ncbi:MAG TPA: ATP-dependent metallopeptidase FtsH/Yme1/Tma family protein, partial [Roseiflexaceae bacterium]|nr:ATP-dependent metallopeptidase FtsH/Yme1/Tma family protein [Roseiflexaceae bacterium]
MGDNRWLKNSFVYLIILVAALALLFNYFNNNTNQTMEKGIYEILNDAKANKVEQIKAQTGSNDIFVTYRGESNKQYHSRLESDSSVTQLLIQAGVPLDSVKV